MMIGNDVGVQISTTRGRQWSIMRLPIGQIYHVATDNRVPYIVYGQMQDDGSMRGPSNSRRGGRIHPALWTTTAGCETGWNTPDPVDPDIVWGGCYAGVVERFDARTGLSRSVSVWPERTMGAPAAEIKLRMNWTFPIAISPHDHQTVYVGSQYVHATSDGGQTWRTISPDLTLNDQSMMGDSGGLTLDNLSVEYAGVVFSIAESPLEKGVIWAGTNDGQVQVTRDGGEHWTNVTPQIPGLPPKGTVEQRRALALRPGHLLHRVDLHQVDNRDPFLYKTTDYGRTWKAIGATIPKSPLSYAHVLREGPHRKGLLFAGTENGLYVSFDDGGRLEPLQSKLPHAPVYWLDDPGALPRPRRRHLRPRLLHPRRPERARAAHGGRARRGRAPLRAAAGLPLPRGGRPSARSLRHRGRQEPALRRVDPVLAEGAGRGTRRSLTAAESTPPGEAERSGPHRAGAGRAGAREGQGEADRDHDPRRCGPEAAEPARHEQGRPQPRLLGPALRADVPGAARGRRPPAIPTSGRRSASAARSTAASSTTASTRRGAGRSWLPGPTPSRSAWTESRSPRRA